MSTPRCAAGRAENEHVVVNGYVACLGIYGKSDGSSSRQVKAQRYAHTVVRDTQFNDVVRIGILIDKLA